MLISFLCVGPQRTGTSWLDRAMRAHSEIHLPENCKETFFFDRHYSRGLPWYREKYFQGIDSTALAGEVGPTYFHNEVVMDRIKRCNANVKVIICIRDPVERTYSLYNHEVTKGRLSDGLFQALKKQPWILESGRYHKYLPMWHQALGERQVLVVTQEKMEEDPDGLYQEVQLFLGVKNIISLPAELSRKYGQGTVPKYPWLAKFSAWSAARLRKAGMHSIVEVGKFVGLKKVFSGGDPSRLTMSNQDRMLLQRLHEKDYRYLHANGYLA